jgi:hypothetical protein
MLKHDAGKRWLAENDPLMTHEGKRAAKRKAKRKLRKQMKQQPIERSEIERREQRRQDITARRALARPILKGVE